MLLILRARGDFGAIVETETAVGDVNGNGVLRSKLLFCRVDEDTEGVEKGEANGRLTTSKDAAIFKFIVLVQWYFLTR